MEKRKKRTISFTVDEADYEKIMQYARAKGHGGRSPVSTFCHFALRKMMNVGLTMNSQENQKFRTTKEYRRWVKDVLKRDGYRCQKCGRTDSLHVHHIKLFREYPALRADITNGITLCQFCHINEHW
jgi:5-methylcytosine-specific restriction endonuclease McrA